MIETLYAHFGFPDAAHLGKRVFKTLFHEHAALTPTDKAALTDDVDTVTWVYTLKPNTVSIPAYQDDQREYLEVAVLQIDLKTQKRTGRIHEVVHRAIPYPVVAIFVFGTLAAIGLAHKRFHQQQKAQIVAEGFELTDWIDLAQPTPAQAAFLASLNVTRLPQSHFLACYDALVDRVVALDCARLSDEFRVESAAEQRAARRERLAACHALELQIADLRATAQKTSQMQRLVELNLDIKRREAELRSLAAGL